MKWRASHKETYNNYMAVHMRKYTAANKEQINNKRMERYHADKIYKDKYKMEAHIFRYILL